MISIGLKIKMEGNKLISCGKNCKWNLATFFLKVLKIIFFNKVIDKVIKLRYMNFHVFWMDRNENISTLMTSKAAFSPNRKYIKGIFILTLILILYYHNHRVLQVSTSISLNISNPNKECTTQIICCGLKF